MHHQHLPNLKSSTDNDARKSPSRQAEDMRLKHHPQKGLSTQFEGSISEKARKSNKSETAARLCGESAAQADGMLSCSQIVHFAHQSSGLEDSSPERSDGKANSSTLLEDRSQGVPKLIRTTEESLSPILSLETEDSAVLRGEEIDAGRQRSLQATLHEASWPPILARHGLQKSSNASGGGGDITDTDVLANPLGTSSLEPKPPLSSREKLAHIHDRDLSLSRCTLSSDLPKTRAKRKKVMPQERGAFRPGLSAPGRNGLEEWTVAAGSRGVSTLEPNLSSQVTGPLQDQSVQSETFYDDVDTANVPIELDGGSYPFDHEQCELHSTGHVDREKPSLSKYSNIGSNSSLKRKDRWSVIGCLYAC